MILPDGPLAYLPFEIVLPSLHGQPWGVSHRLRYAPSLGVLEALGRRPRNTDRSDRAVLAVGVADGGSGGGRFESKPLPALPHAVLEARAVTEMFAAVGAESLIGADASRARLLALDLRRYRYLHFATHALVSDRRPEQTRLLLSSGDALALADIQRLRLNAELITLSACDSALGLRLRGEDLIGLPYAFLAAGARSVLVALWRIDDQAARRFMVRFYGHLQRGLEAAEALRAVRAEWLAAEPKDHPARWAPFILVSAPSPRRI